MRDAETSSSSFSASTAAADVDVHGTAGVTVQSNGWPGHTLAAQRHKDIKATAPHRPNPTY